MAEDIGLFALAEKRLGYIDMRQRQVAQNIANADTPHYQPMELPPFASFLERPSIEPARTSALHLAALETSQSNAQALPSQRAPDGNAVNLEDQLGRVADNEGAAALVGNLWKSYMGLFMTALGHAG